MYVKIVLEEDVNNLMEFIMFEFVKIILSNGKLWIYLEATWYITISILYYITIPWIIWGSLILFIIQWLFKNNKTDESLVNQVFGVNPLLYDKNDDKLIGDESCMTFIAHRGGGYDYPENSLSAFNNSKKKGCLAVEFDLSRTRDNIPIIFHDHTIERLTGKVGNIKDMTWDQLKHLDISFSHPLREKFKGEKIALLSDTIEQCLNDGLHLFIDVKDPSLDIVPMILNIYKKYPELYHKAAITSFYPHIIYLLRRREPKIVTCLSFKNNFFSTLPVEFTKFKLIKLFKPVFLSLIDHLHEWALPRFTYYILGISAIMLHKDLISPYTIDKWRQKGIRIIGWNINLPSEKSYFTKVLRVTYLTDTFLGEKTID